MKEINTIILLLVFGLCYSCSQSQDIISMKNFIYHHGEDDFSIFEGVTLFHRGAQDSLFIAAGLMPAKQGDKENVKATTFYYATKDNSLLKIERSDNTWFDSGYISAVAKRFAELKIYEIQADYYGTVDIHLNESYKSLLVRFENDSILRKRSKECHWERLSGNWYIPKY